MCLIRVAARNAPARIGMGRRVTDELRERVAEAIKHAFNSAPGEFDFDDVCEEARPTEPDPATIERMANGIEAMIVAGETRAENAHDYWRLIALAAWRAEHEVE